VTDGKFGFDCREQGRQDDAGQKGRKKKSRQQEQMG
jgi:hypothetical protein